MLSKETFIKAINTLDALSAAEDRLYKATDGALLLCDFTPYANAVDMYVKILEDGMNAEVDDRYGSDISYFIYELDFGRKWKPGTITEADGTDIDLSTAEKLYDYLVSLQVNKKV